MPAAYLVAALAPPVEIPDPEQVRRRLAAVVTEAAVLRSQLRVSNRAERERERLRRLGITAPADEGVL